MKQKSKTTGYLLAFFFGGVGAHAFYFRKYIRGSLYLLFCWTTIPIFLGWIDMFFIKAWHKSEQNNSLTPINKAENKLEYKFNEKLKRRLENNPKDKADGIYSKTDNKIELDFPHRRADSIPDYDYAEPVGEVSKNTEKSKLSGETTPLKSESIRSAEKHIEDTDEVINSNFGQKLTLTSDNEQNVTWRHNMVELTKETPNNIKQQKESVESTLDYNRVEPLIKALKSVAEIKTTSYNEEESQNTDKNIEDSDEVINSNLGKEPNLDSLNKQSGINRRNNLVETVRATAKNIGKLEKPLTTQFYDESTVILPKYSDIKTPKEILEHIVHLKKTKSEPHYDYTNGISWRDDKFIMDSLKYATKTTFKSSEIPLKAYWTTFTSLNHAQKHWYFYWREQVLSGKYPDTDLSYIILFVYELINYSFNQNAAFNVSMMARLHDNYLERIPKVRDYLGGWMGDMLYELGRSDLAEEWITVETHEPTLYRRLKDNHDDLPRISIRIWQSYVKNHRESKFFEKNKYKIYKVFRESIPLLQEIYKKEGFDLIERYFVMREEKEVRRLFSSAVMGRSVEPIHVKTKKIYPTKHLTNEVTALYRLSENVTRLLANEKRELNVDETCLPEGFKTIMLDHFSPTKQTTDKRFKVVQESTNVNEDYGKIPAAPEVTPPTKTKPDTELIQFDKDKIKTFRADTDNLIEVINSRSEIEEEKALQIPTSTNTTVDIIEANDSTNEPTTTLDIFAALEGEGGADGDKDFIESLTDTEKEFLLKFENGSYKRAEANLYIKKNGFMLGAFISELNEKANDYLGDTFLEDQGEEIVIYEEYEHLILTLMEEL